MAARRLLIVLALLLVASVIAAALAPDRNRRGAGSDDTSAQETTETTTPEAIPSEPGGTLGDDFSDRIDASPKDPQTVEGFVGDQLALSVGSDLGRTITIAPLGLAEFAGPDAPAHFNLLLREPGTYPITAADDPAVILGRLVVAEPAAAKDEDKAGGGDPEGSPGRN